MIEVEIPELFGADKAAWHVVLDLADADLPRWVLAGGLMVNLHLYEAGATPGRATTDVDAVVDVSVGAVRATEAFSRRLQDDLHMRMEPPNAETGDAQARARRADTLRLARAAQPVPVGESVMGAWARLVADCRAARIHRTVKLLDALIAATAVDLGLPVITQDDDYDQMAGVHSGLAVVKV